MKTRAERQAEREAHRRLAARGLAMLDEYEAREHPVDHSPLSTIRPDPKTAQDFWLRFVGAGAFTAIALLLVYLTEGHSDAALYGLITAVILFPGAYLAMRRSFRTEVLTATPGGGLEFRNWVGRTTTVGRGDVARLVLQSVNVSTISPRPPKSYLFVVDGKGRCRLRVLMSIFDPNDVHRFIPALGVPVDERAAVVKPLQVRNELPGSFLWYTAHPWLGALLLMPVLLALVVLLAVLFPSHGG